MKIKRLKICRAILTSLLIVTALFAFFFAGGYRKAQAGDNVNYKKKVISVLFDNSGSMEVNNDTVGMKKDMVRYSLQILIDLLDKDDILWICPMNEKSGANPPFKIDLSDDNLAETVKNKINEITFGGSTPPESIGNAINILKNQVDEQYRLKESNEMNANDDSVEHWLIMLTDGAFNGLYNPSTTNDEIVNYIDDYSSLKTLYLCVSDKNKGTSGYEAMDLTDENLSLNQGYPFSPYYIEPGSDNEIKNKLTLAMQDIASKLSARYDGTNNTREGQENAVSQNGNKVVIDINKLGFAVSDIAVLVQDNNAQLLSIEDPNGLIIERQGSITGEFEGRRIMGDGSITVIRNQAGEIIADRQVVLNYNKNPGTKVSVFFKPALILNAFIEREKDGVWERADFDVVNSEMKPGDKIRVNYEVRSSSDNRLISLNEIFGVPTEKITYCKKGYQKGDPITLEKGNNAIDVAVSVFDGSYTLYSSVMCYIEQDPTAYRIESVLTPKTGLDHKKADVLYTLFRENGKISQAEIGKYSFEVKAVYPDGSEHTLRPDGILVNNDIQVLFNGDALPFGAYRIKATVTETETQLKRVKEDTFNILPATFTVAFTDANAEQYATTAYLLGKGDEKTVGLYIKVDGEGYSFDSEYVRYKLFFGNQDITDKCTVSGGDASYKIDENFPDTAVGDKTLRAEVTFLGEMRATAEYTFKIMPSVYQARALPMGERELDLYNLRTTNAGVYFEVIKDGYVLPAEEITQALLDGEITVDKNPAGWIALLPCKLDVTVETEDDKAFIACRVGRDFGAPWDSLFSSFIFANEKTVTLNYNNVSAADAIEINTFSFIGKLWRWIVILAIILFIIHVILYLFGFVIARPLPKGTLLCFDIGYTLRGPLDGVMRKKVNMKKSEIIKWHLSRFIPFKVFKDQKPVKFFAVTISVDKKSKNPVLTAKCDVVSLIFSFPPTNEGDAINAMLMAYAKNKTPDLDKITKSGFMNSSRKSDNTVIKRGRTVSAYGWYGTPEEVRVGRPEVITQVFTFIKYRKK